MDLTYTPEQDAFRAEVRAWLSDHVPAEPLEHYDATLHLALSASQKQDLVEFLKSL